MRFKKFRKLSYRDKGKKTLLINLEKTKKSLFSFSKLKARLKIRNFIRHPLKKSISNKQFLIFKWYLNVLDKNLRLANLYKNRIAYILKNFANTNFNSDLFYQDRKLLSFEKVSVTRLRFIFKNFLVLKTFSKNFYLFKRVYHYLKVLKKIKNIYAFKKRKFSQLFFFRLDMILLQLSLFKNLIIIRKLILNGYILLNNKTISKPNKLILSLDIISFTPFLIQWIKFLSLHSKVKTKIYFRKKWKLQFFDNLIAFRKTNRWYEFDKKNFNSFILLTYPKLKFSNFKKDFLFQFKLSLHKKQNQFLLNYIKR